MTIVKLCADYFMLNRQPHMPDSLIFVYVFTENAQTELVIPI
jgi:hypothetical protein